MARSLSGTSDFSDELARMRTRAQSLFGVDPSASALARRTLPYTPWQYSRLIYSDIAETFYPAGIYRADAETGAIVARARADRRTLSDSEIAELRQVNAPGNDLVIKMSQALSRAYDLGPAPGQGMTTVQNAAGVPCLNSGANMGFWDALSEYAINAGATRAHVTSQQRWEAFKVGVGDAANAVAEAVGKALAEAAEVAGKAAGGAAAGFVKGMGPVMTVLALGTGYLIWRVT